MKTTTLIAGGLIGAACLMSGQAVAHGDANDDGFLQAIHDTDNNGNGALVIRDDATSIAIAKQACTYLDKGYSFMRVAETIHVGSPLTLRQATRFTGLAVVAYCGKYIDEARAAQPD